MKPLVTVNVWLLIFEHKPYNDREIKTKINFIHKLPQEYQNN
jgi:hypothetical protein